MMLIIPGLCISDISGKLGDTGISKIRKSRGYRYLVGTRRVGAF